MDRFLLPSLIVVAFIFVFWTLQRSGPTSRGSVQTQTLMSAPNSASLTPSPAGAADINYFTNADYALHVGLVQHKPVVVLITVDTHCHDCVHMLNDVIPSAQVQPYHNRFIWLQLDFGSDDAKGLLKQYREAYDLKILPYILYFREDGSYSGCSGVLDADDFSRKLESVASSAPSQ